jgi:hypothetical protein
MKTSRFSLQASDQRKLVTISHRGIDAIACAHATRRARLAAREEDARQALRDALRRH